jgi:hypothetical protein
MAQSLDIKRGIIYYGLTQSTVDQEDSSKMRDLIERIKNFSKSSNIRKEKPDRMSKR